MQMFSAVLRTRSRAHLDLENLAGEPESHYQTQKCCRNLNSPVEGRRHTGVTEEWGETPGFSEPKAGLLSPVRWLAGSQDREGCWGRTWGCVPQGASLPGQPRASSYGGPTPTPRCPAEGYNAGAGVLKEEIKTHILITAHFLMWRALF